ncbi:MAG: hypothetical protein ACK4JF_07765 [Methylohalobius sp.]
MAKCAAIVSTASWGAWRRCAPLRSIRLSLPVLRYEVCDPSRTITTSFLGDPLAQGFALRVPPPDRDYATFGADLSATFAYGVSAFVGYEALVGFQHISSHRITGGFRIQF